jgi:hypothetical protein
MFASVSWRASSPSAGTQQQAEAQVVGLLTLYGQVKQVQPGYCFVHLSGVTAFNALCVDLRAQVTNSPDLESVVAFRHNGLSSQNPAVCCDAPSLNLDAPPLAGIVQ